MKNLLLILSFVLPLSCYAQLVNGTSIAEIDDTTIEIEIHSSGVGAWDFTAFPYGGFKVLVKTSSSEKRVSMYKSVDQMKLYSSYVSGYDYKRTEQVLEQLKKDIKIAYLEVMDDFEAWGFKPLEEDEWLEVTERDQRLSIRNITLKKI